jgi:hypothetical protein
VESREAYNAYLAELKKQQHLSAMTVGEDES